MIPRPYQRSAINALYEWFRQNPQGNPMLVLPTGSGKSVILATLIREILETWPGQRVLMLTHVKELIAQNATKLGHVWPLAPMGIYSAGLRRRDTFEPIIFAGIQSVANKAMQLGRFDLVVVDECHLISHKGEGQYRDFLRAATEINPALRIVGLTATPFRTGHGSLLHGENALFHDIAYEVQMLDLIEQGYLAPLVSKPTVTEVDLSSVQSRNGEFVAGQLERATDRDEITQAALDEVEQYGRERKRWLIFCAGVAHAEHVAEAVRARGIRAGCVTGKTKPGERDRLIAQYRAGQLRALTNANVLTTGFDAPETDLLVMLRGTQSPGLYVQIAGRGMRTAPAKTDCLVLDFVGNAKRHGPVDQVRAWIPRPKEGSSEAPMKACPECRANCATSVRICPTCRYEFLFDDRPGHDTTANTAPLLSTELAPDDQRAPVTAVFYSRHTSRYGTVPTLRVDYYHHLERIASEWICLEHQGYARAKAAQWWLRRCPGCPVPSTVADALLRKDALSQPVAIVIDTKPKYPEIIGYEWTAETDADREGRDGETAADRYGDREAAA